MGQHLGNVLPKKIARIIPAQKIARIKPAHSRLTEWAPMTDKDKSHPGAKTQR